MTALCYGKGKYTLKLVEACTAVNQSVPNSEADIMCGTTYPEKSLSRNLGYNVLVQRKRST